ncbi:MAG TPA: cupin [Bacillota bacterium]|jgi:quercetin dioxygenase-like cupin family protein|nr:cupin [Peptococcaceae bacterium MAG4]NLW38988.1 cupin [Peptococcaceae bacterium]HPZ43388.1 cupin [Bacillota bacterium]HQD76392.1 cupin [Bacillota bacterium]HUM58915.1 cupin [Bacillota bacterium]
MYDTYHFFERIMDGKVVFVDREASVKDLQWNPHAQFKGVFLKHLIKGDSTGGKFSYHLVKISEGCEIGDHIHEGKYEVHEVVGGVGKGVMNGVEIVYEPGVMVVVPDSVVHKISADKGNLYILAKFIPALL